MDIQNSVSILVENNSRIHILAADGGEMFLNARIVRDPTTGEKWLEVELDKTSSDFAGRPLQIAVFGQVGDCFSTQELAPEPAQEDVVCYFPASNPEVDFHGVFYLNGHPVVGQEYVDMLRDAVDRLVKRVTALENMPVYNGEVEDV